MGFICRVVTILPALVVVLLTRMLRPFITVRFGRITSYIFGHFVFDTEYYLSEREHQKQRSLDLFFYYFKYKSHRAPTNSQWDRMVKRSMHVNPVFSILYRANKIVPGSCKHEVKLNVEFNGSRDNNGIFAHTQRQIGFLEEENDRSLELLGSIGFKPNDAFVSLNVRDSLYKEKYQNWKADWSYHKHRDSDITSYEKAARLLAERGYWVFRMGKAVNSTFDIKHPKIIDYANSSLRNDLLDIWLMANCNFCISNGTGLDNVSIVFRKPIVFVNFIPVSLYLSSIHSITLPKKARWKTSGQLLSLKELLQHGYSRADEYELAGIEIVDSSAEEIENAVAEMLERLGSQWCDSQENQFLHQKQIGIFREWDDFKTYHGWIHPEARISSHFLLENKDWFLA